jgi:hypothetical protein
MTKVVKGLLSVGLIAIGSQIHAAPQAAQSPAVCVGVPDAERYVWLVTNRQDVVAVQEVKTQEPMVYSVTPEPHAGARILLAARSGETAEWIQRIAECHIAWNAARGYPRDASSALDVKGAVVHVSSTGDAFAVEITSTDVRAAREILRRVRALLANSSAP